MKYIRTKDGIVDMETIYNPLKKKLDLEQYDILAFIKNEHLIQVDKKDIIKQADTIKKLCDEFVVIGYKIKDPFIFSKEGISIDDFWKHSPSDTIVYGAIWTEWGLKYVAKMNDKGELCLL